MSYIRPRMGVLIARQVVSDQSPIPIFFFFFSPRGRWDLSFPPRDGTCTPRSGSAES